MKCCYFWFRSEVKIFDIFLDLVIFPYFNAISIDFNAFFNLHLLCNFHVFMWKNAYIKDLNALRIVMNMDRMIGGILLCPRPERSAGGI